MSAPLTPPDCDLRGLAFMPLDVVRLLDSDLFALSTGDEFKAALALWCKSWNQVPAGSISADERVLAKNVGVSLNEWRTISEMALRGWVQCDDGRLYHPVVAVKVLEAWIERVGHRKRSAQGNAKRYGHEFDPAPFDASISTALGLLAALNPGQPAPVAKEPVLAEGGETARSKDEEPLLEGGKNAPKGQGQGERSKEPLSGLARTRSASCRGSRIDSDWQPSELDRAYAAKQGFTPPAIERMAERFRNYWLAKTGKDATKLDWSATWRNWVLAEADRRPPTPQAPQQTDWI